MQCTSRWYSRGRRFYPPVWQHFYMEIGHEIISTAILRNKWATSLQNQQNDCAPSELRSAWASAQSDQSSLCAQLVAKVPSFLHAESEDWSDWLDAQAHLSLRWAHSYIVGFVMSQLKCGQCQEQNEPHYEKTCLWKYATRSWNSGYRKKPKISDTRKFIVITLKIEQNGVSL